MNHTGDDMQDDTTRSPGDERPEPDELLLGELTAALASDALSPLDALPESVSMRAIHAGEAMVRAQRGSASASVSGAPVSEVASSRGIAVRALPAQPIASRITTWSGWLAAAALFAFVISDSTSDSVAPAAPLVASASALRDSILASDCAVVPLSWTATADASAVRARGDVVWSGRAQRGVMRIVGLLANDKTRWQYQLWIFDKNRDQRFPVDGGVFDIPADGAEVFVPIDARLPVGDATLFAITVEPVGGVVVSTRERIALTAGL
jgi:anti-sigma-K factor RskA